VFRRKTRQRTETFFIIDLIYKGIAIVKFVINVFEFFKQRKRKKKEQKQENGVKKGLERLRI